MSDWLANNGAKVDDETSIDDIFEASDDFSKQVLKAMAEDQALEDVEYEVESLFKVGAHFQARCASIHVKAGFASRTRARSPLHFMRC
eukprot:scaffold1650_cov351-Prasinococcus_capsulatus_cf.AAC.15